MVKFIYEKYEKIIIMISFIIHEIQYFAIKIARRTRTVTPKLVIEKAGRLCYDRR